MSSLKNNNNKKKKRLGGKGWVVTALRDESRCLRKRPEGGVPAGGEWCCCRTGMNPVGKKKKKKVRYVEPGIYH